MTNQSPAWERLIVNAGIVLVFGAFVLRFLIRFALLYRATVIALFFGIAEATTDFIHNLL